MTFNITQLCDVDIEVIDGDRGKNYPHQDELYNSGYCLFLSAKNVTQNGFLFVDNQFITKEKDDLLNNGKLKREDIVITTRGTVGNVAIYSDNVPFDSVRINSGMLIVRCRNDIDNYYLYQVLRSKWFYNQIISIQSGSAQPQLPKSHFLKMTIPMPDMETQQKIAVMLSRIDDKIALNSAINENLASKTQNLFFSAVRSAPFVHKRWQLPIRRNDPRQSRSRQDDFLQQAYVCRGCAKALRLLERPFAA